MRKTLLCFLTLTSATLHSAFGQSPWVAPPSAIEYVPRYSTQGLLWKLESAGQNALWGRVQQAIQTGPGSRDYLSWVFSTADNGQSWQKGYFSSNDLAAIDGQNAWLLSGGKLLRTTSGAADFVPLPAVLPAAFTSIYFFSATTGIALPTVDPNSAVWPVFRTTDGGLTWAMVQNLPVRSGSPAPYGQSVFRKQRVGNHLWLSIGTHLLHTLDQGLTWTVVANPGNATFTDPLNSLSVYITGSGPSVVQHVARSTDGGASWTEITFTGQPAAGALTAIPGLPGTFIGYEYKFPGASNLATGKLRITRDWGSSWQLLGTEFTSGVIQNLVAQSPTVLWAGMNGETGFTDQPVVMRYGGTVLASKPTDHLTAALTVYPNPTTAQVQLAGDLPGTEQVRVYDAAGRLCQQQTVSNTQRTLDLTRQPAGLYQVQVTAASGMVRHLRVNKIQ